MLNEFVNNENECVFTPMELTSVLLEVYFLAMTSKRCSILTLFRPGWWGGGRILPAPTLDVSNFFLIIKQTLPNLATFSKNYLGTISYDR